MSRVIPTKPGWWWVSICGDPPIAKFVHMDEDGDLFIIRGDDEEQPLDSIGAHWVWLAPVPSAEAVQAAVEAMRRAVEICGYTGNFETVSQLCEAIKGLTQKGSETE